jgi:hypothetical protein
MRHDLDRAISALRRIENTFAGLEIDSSLLALPGKLLGPVVTTWLQAANLPLDLTSRISMRLRCSQRYIRFPEIHRRLRAQLKRLDVYLHKRINLIGTKKEMEEEVGQAVAHLEDPSEEEEVVIPCDTSTEVLILCIVLIIVVVADLLIRWADESETDEAPRRLFLTASCEDLREIPDRDLIVALERLSRGPTLDGDERAILRLFSCLSCDHLARIWNAESIEDRGAGRISTRLLYDFDGKEWDQLMLRLKECHIVDFSAFDDDATRLFINSNDCSVLSRLSDEDLRQLLLNLFSGSTGDDDEQAIIRLIECIPLFRVAVLLRMPGLSYDDFDDEVDGAEWRRLRARLEAAQAVYM